MSPAQEHSHEPWLVVLSLMIAFQGSYVGLHLARRIVASSGGRLRLLITASALSIALAIWSMHFIGMLALHFPVAVDFLVLPTLMSFLICILAVGFAIFIVGEEALTPTRLGLASLLMGAGIGGMNYVGMLALHTGMQMTYVGVFAAAGVAVGSAVSMVALWLGFAPHPVANPLVRILGSTFPAAVLLALTMLAVHFTVVAGLEVSSEYRTSPSTAPVLSQESLSIIVAVIAFSVSAMFLLILVPETANGERAARSAGDANRLAQPVTQPQKACADPAEPAPSFQVSLPVATGDGRRRAMAAEQIVAIQAQAHYCVIFDGETEWFCPLSITEVESMLDSSVFARVHRSHIVNLDKIAFVARGGEAAAIETLTAVSHKVPVSRSRRVWLKKLLQERQPAAGSRNQLQ